MSSSGIQQKDQAGMRLSLTADLILSARIKNGGNRDDKTGWWGVDFNITLEGETVRFDDLSECSQEHILQKISEGYTSGEVVEEDDDEEEEQ